jgi:alkanesulfonate monooxygenase SsuD/methylene tetrahydromethanopterin reductase-like flavin-dependent oxidoreductase (luciferase family)
LAQTNLCGVTRLGVFVVPTAVEPDLTVEQIVAADGAGLDLVGVQDHPYQRRFFDTWTLLSYVAARTERISLVPDVVCVPLRQPAVLAKAAASLDLLSGGRVELGVGAGSFWDAIEAFGGPRRTPGESVTALAEAMRIMRAFLDTERSVNLDGEHYRAKGAKPGPAPAHRVGLWVGAYGPRMLRLTGRLGDGWLPSLGNLTPDEIAARHETIDEAARRAGRDPADIVRAVNVGGEDPTVWLDPERVAGLAERYRFDALLLPVPAENPIDHIERLGEMAAALRAG